MAFSYSNIEWGTSGTSENTQPILSYAQEGYKDKSIVNHEHLNFLLNQYYENFKAIGEGKVFIVAEYADSDTLEALDTTDLENNSQAYIKGQGIYYLDKTNTLPTDGEIVIGDWILTVPSIEFLQAYYGMTINDQNYEISELEKRIYNLENP